MSDYYKNEEKYQAAMKELSQEGITLTYLAKKYGFDRVCFSKYLKKHGIEVMHSYRSKETTDTYMLAAERYLAHEGSIKTIATEMGISVKSFGTFLKERNWTRNGFTRENYTLTDDYFEVIDSADKAYWLGMLFADGCVIDGGKDTGGKITLELADVDIKHLYKFKEALNYNGKIRHRNNKAMSSISIYRNKMVHDLSAKGCVQNKTYQGWIDVQVIKGFELDFIRGFLDGDGYIEQNLKKHRVVFAIKQLSVAETLCELLQDYEPTIYFDRSNPGKIVCKVAVERKDNFHRLLKDLYVGANTYLDRKYSIAMTRLYARQSQLSLEDSGKKSAELSGDGQKAQSESEGAV